MNELFQKAKDAKDEIQSLTMGDISKILNEYADVILQNIEDIIYHNSLDIKMMNPDDPKIDRLLLNKQRIEAIANDVRKVSSFNFNPFGIIDQRKTEKGLEIIKQSCPIGVVGMIYESRPNVTVDAISLCLKSQNVSILKGSKEADNSNLILTSLAREILIKHGINPNCITLLPSDRESTKAMINAIGYIDVCIPRGGKGLIEFIRNNAKIPVIETGAGVVHIYIDKSANIEMASSIIFNAKTRRPSVCNSVDCILVHKNLLPELSKILKKTMEYGVEVTCDEEIARHLSNEIGVNVTQNPDYSTEFLSLKMCVKTVDNINDAILHIRKYSSNHTDAIITNNDENKKKFIKSIDSAVVNINTSTSFTDGGEFEMLSEIGISTQKLHARGPFSLDALLSYKWIVNSDGAVR